MAGRDFLSWVFSALLLLGLWSMPRTGFTEGNTPGNIVDSNKTIHSPSGSGIGSQKSTHTPEKTQPTGIKSPVNPAPGPKSGLRPSIPPAAGPLPIAIHAINLKSSMVYVSLRRTETGTLPAGGYGKIELTLASMGRKPYRTWSLLQVDPGRKLSRKGAVVDFNTGISLKPGVPVKAVLACGDWHTAKQTTLSAGEGGKPRTASETQGYPKNLRTGESGPLMKPSASKPLDKTKPAAALASKDLMFYDKRMASLAGKPARYKSGGETPYIRVVRVDPQRVVPHGSIMTVRYSFVNFDPALHAPVDVEIFIYDEMNRRHHSVYEGPPQPDTDVDIVVNAPLNLCHIEITAHYDREGTHSRFLRGEGDTFLVGYAPSATTESGIRVTLLEAGLEVRPGARIHAGYSFTDPEAPLPEQVEVRLRRGSTHDICLYLGPPVPDAITEWDLPADLFGWSDEPRESQLCRIRVYATAEEDERIGHSEPFLIEKVRAGRRVDLIVNEAGEWVHPGAGVTVRYSFWDPTLPETVRLSLRHHADGRIPAVYPLYEGPPQAGRDVRLTLPADIVGYDYRILLTCPGGSDSRNGESASFSISPVSPPRDRSGDCEGCVFVCNPVGGEVWTRGETATITWLYTGTSSDIPEFNVILVNDPDRGGGMPITTDRIAWDSELRSCTLWTDAATYMTPGRRYYVRVSVRGGGASDVSDGAITVVE
jgi:hypothetical protein